MALVATFIGTIIGATAGYFGGKLDNFLMRVTDLFLALPLLVGADPAAQPARRGSRGRSTVMGNAGSMRATIVILSLFFWMPTARIVRGVVLSLKEKEFVEAARALGASDKRIIFRHLLPNSAGPIIVTVTLNVAAAILTESALSFLGFGVSPPVPDVGQPARRQQGLLRHRSVARVVPGPHGRARGARRELHG